MPSSPKIFHPAGWEESKRKARLQQQRQYDRVRGSFRKRGYTKTWDALKKFLKTCPEFSLCAGVETDCGEHTYCIDHISAMTGPNDPRFFEVANLAPLCRACHAKKTCMFDGALGVKPVAGQRAETIMRRMLTLAKERAAAIEARGI